ncbi:ferrous iron transport protein B [Marispirochaeta aestuarii]|uniref:Ferrous iron transport protein B n=1 Tax=Marispirochaeta aestuarii TaxID=1963862 RepID=A0A1Y1RZP1_9SPIO|nr:Fe(2+) transporter permease subunit FeoB [Marispirochaeta aestuarii]ORC36265.1 ferrous iron transport protein B [Marispirochaeta aestuarii]
MSATLTRMKTIALAGNPNCGKTTIFNALTGSSAKVGNWPGVTVERREGRLKGSSAETAVVDLPGIYSLSAESEDERVARDFIISGSVDLVISIVDAANLERNLFLTSTILESGIPTVVALNMMDAAKKKGIRIDLKALSDELGCPVLPLSAIQPESLKNFRNELDRTLSSGIPAPKTRIKYSPEIESTIGSWSKKLSGPASELGVTDRFIALSLLEEDPFITEHFGPLLGEEEIEKALSSIGDLAGTTVDMLIADNRYSWINSLCNTATSRKEEGTKRASRGGLDAILLHRFLGIPIFLGVMYLVFWFTMAVGGSFIDFFDILFGGIFVDGLGTLMAGLGSPEWLTAIIAGGIGGGIQTVSTFIPIIFTMFLMLALLEDSGYMARAAFVMDKAMRAIGLPGKAFVPMLVGFGCTVPAIMATRTLESKRDRFMAIFMTPFMSCGARLPVYALFTAAFFGNLAGGVVFSIYLAGVLLAVLTGLLLKHTLFKGKHTPFVMELPAYHSPRMGHIMNSAWRRLKIYMFRAGKVIILVVLLLSVLNSWGTDGTFGNEDSEESVLSVIGKSITPVFTPMGIVQENWPATVSLFTGLFAKEAVVGTLNALYSQESFGGEEPAEDEEPWSLAALTVESLASIGENLSGVLDGLLDPLGLGLISSDADSLAEELETDDSVFTGLRDNFSPVSAYAFLLFILIYFPCVAALGAAVQETGKGYGTVLVTYLTLLAWIISTLVFQILEGGSLLWITVALLLLAGIFVSFTLMGRGRERLRYPG